MGSRTNQLLCVQMTPCPAGTITLKQILVKTFLQIFYIIMNKCVIFKLAGIFMVNNVTPKLYPNIGWMYWLTFKWRDRGKYWKTHSSFLGCNCISNTKYKTLNNVNTISFLKSYKHLHLKTTIQIFKYILPGISLTDCSFMNSTTSSGFKWYCPFGLAFLVAIFACRMFPPARNKFWYKTKTGHI